MAATQTQFFHLNQWLPDDPVLREDFNGDNQKLDSALNTLSNAVRLAGNAHVEYASYVGNGSGTVSLTFSHTPLMVFVMGEHSFLIPGGIQSGTLLHDGSSSGSRFQWKGSTVRWDTPSPAHWNNEKGKQYQYFVIAQAHI